MKTLNQHNKERVDALARSLADVWEPLPNGIECPNCKKELWDSDPLHTLSSILPKKDVHCPGCGYTGYRIL